MSSSIQSTSTALVVYDPTLPHISLKFHLETLVDGVYKRSFEVAKKESSLLSQSYWKERVVAGVASGVRHLYIDKEVGEKMARLILHNFSKGTYDGYASLYEFKDAILKDLRSVYPDKHLDLLCTEEAIPRCDPDRSLHTLRPEEYTEEQTQYLASLKNTDQPDLSHAVRASIIPGTNIGYFQINEFFSPDFPEAMKDIDEGMKSVVDAEALIIDLRNNTGGNPATVAYLASYLFDSRQLWNQIYQRSTDETTSFYVEPEKLEHVFGGKKLVYVLTSSRTFSAAEELAYGLQSCGRAKIVGQTTKGGAHTVRPYVVDDHTYIIVPYTTSINPHTSKNWEGTGVMPDIPISTEYMR
ncbi:MAG TPA: S41 family peptidase [Rhabdochlamydiaceae bacterium]|jgi:hypothetical protein